MKYAHYDATTGDILGHYDDTIHASVPVPNLPLSDSGWRDCVDNGEHRRVDIVNKVVVNYTPPPLSPTDHATSKITALTIACRAHITGGVVSAALGAAHTYPTSETDQLNLNGCVTSSLVHAGDATWSRPFWCADVDGVWDRRNHDQAQIQAVGVAVETHVREAQNKLKQLNDQLQAIVVNAALTDDEKRTAINAVIW